MSSGFVTPGSIQADESSEDGAVFYGVGICYASVCMPENMAIDDVLDAANRRWPTGLAHGWSVSLDKTFATGPPNPCPCEQTPGRIHRLLEC